MRVTTVMLPPKLKAKASSRARKLGIAMGEFIRDAMDKALADRRENVKGTMFDPIVYKGRCPADVSRNIDKYLYGNGR